MTAHTGIRSVFRWFFPAVLAFTVALGLVGDRRVAANSQPTEIIFAGQIDSLYAILADQESFDSLSGLLEYNSLWDFCIHEEGEGAVHIFSFAGKEPHMSRVQTLAFTVFPDQSLPAGSRVEGPGHGFSYLTGDRHPVATNRECLKILRAAFGDDRVKDRFKDFLEFDPIESMSVEPLPESADHRLTIRSPSDHGEDPRTISWRVQSGQRLRVR